MLSNHTRFDNHLVMAAVPQGGGVGRDLSLEASHGVTPGTYDPSPYF